MDLSEVALKAKVNIVIFECILCQLLLCKLLWFDRGNSEFGQGRHHNNAKILSLVVVRNLFNSPRTLVISNFQHSTCQWRHDERLRFSGFSCSAHQALFYEVKRMVQFF
jgi:hypothetical protein